MTGLPCHSSAIYAVHTSRLNALRVHLVQVALPPAFLQPQRVVIIPAKHTFTASEQAKESEQEQSENAERRKRKRDGDADVRITYGAQTRDRLANYASKYRMYTHMPAKHVTAEILEAQPRAEQEGIKT